MLNTSSTTLGETNSASPLFTPRLAFCAGAIVALQAALLMYVVSHPKIPFPGASSIEQLPAAIAILSLINAIFWAPFLFSENDREILPRLAFIALWQTVVLAFFMMVSARLTPVDGTGIVFACATFLLVSHATTLLARIAAKAFPGIIFFWIFALPVCAYILSEIFLMSPAGNMGWAQAAGPKANLLRSCVHWLLNLSPGTAIVGMLSGTLADQSETSRAIPLSILLIINLFLLMLLRRRTSASSATQ